MTVIPFPADRMADRIQTCIAVHLEGDVDRTINRTVDFLQLIEKELREKGFPEDEVERQVDAFLVKVHAAMMRASAAGL